MWNACTHVGDIHLRGFCIMSSFPALESLWMTLSAYEWLIKVRNIQHCHLHDAGGMCMHMFVISICEVFAFIRKKLKNYPCTSVRTTCVGRFASIASFPSICSSGKDSESYRSNHPLTEARKASKASKATDVPPILPTQPPTLPTQPPTLPTQPPPYGS